MAGREPDAADAGHLPDRCQQFREAHLPFRIAIAVYVLAEELNLGVPLVSDAARFFEH